MEDGPSEFTKGFLAGIGFSKRLQELLFRHTDWRASWLNAAGVELLKLRFINDMRPNSHHSAVSMVVEHIKDVGPKKAAEEVFSVSGKVDGIRATT